MQIEHKSLSQPLFFHLINSCDTQIQIDFLQFLQTETVFMIALSAKKCKKQQQFFKLALVYAYFKTYLNRIDRSYYYLFYEQRQFLNLQKGFIINITKSSYDTFYQFTNQYEQNFQLFKKITNFLTLTNQEEQQGQQQQQLKKIIQNIFFQTDYPLPPFLRETIGIYTITPFQQFLLSIRYPTLQPPEQYIEPPLIRLRQYFQDEGNLKKIIELICENLSQNLNKMSILKYCPYEYQKINWSSIQINDFTLHNFIVILYQFIFINAKVNKRLIQEHKDPIMKIAEFVTRANIYKNIIISIEEKFGFLFQLYEDIYENLTKNSQHNQLPKFKFWNAAMTIWIQQSKEMEDQLFQSFNYILLKQREINLKKFLQEKSQSFPSIYNSIKYEVEKNSLFDNLKSQVYENLGQVYQNFFQNNIDSYEVLGKDFLEHQIDTSINQVNVHKIGHSQHVIKRIPFFNNFIQNIKKVSNLFYQHVQKLIYKVIPDKQMRLGTLKDLIKNDLAFIHGKFTRPVILREIIKNSQQFMRSLIDTVPQFAVFPQEGVQKFGLHWDFSHEDNLLDYFNSQAQIPDDCPIQLRSFFDTNKQLVAHQIISLANSYKLSSQIADSQMQEQSYEQSSFENQSFYSSQDF